MHLLCRLYNKICANRSGQFVCLATETFGMKKKGAPTIRFPKKALHKKKEETRDSRSEHTGPFIQKRTDKNLNLRIPQNIRSRIPHGLDALQRARVELRTGDTETVPDHIPQYGTPRFRHVEHEHSIQRIDGEIGHVSQHR